VSSGISQLEIRMLPDGFYSVKFQRPAGSGGGVVVLSGGKLRGGDSSIVYSGTYSQTGDDFSAKVATSRHLQGLPSVFGKDNVNIVLNGKSSGTTATCTGTAAEVPGVSLQTTLTRISD
jgi:hypothetical protein